MKKISVSVSHQYTNTNGIAAYDISTKRRWVCAEG